MQVSETRHVKKSRRAYICDWCDEKIDTGSEYYTWFTYGENVTARLHPECYEAMFMAHLDDELPMRGDYRRGCWCGENEEHCLCNK